ncbi:MAG: heat-inducible transcriptional repressor HrcA [Ignavibacteria bacterium]|nr:heat-inducible transcriptional repressor HrcA [Ignavibacteria bacterium]
MKPNLLKIKTKEAVVSLNERESLVLRAIVQLHISTAQPIGSRLLSKYLENKLKLSPASIRNIMSELEEMELLQQTHISSGRIPTDKGYRYYIDTILPQVKPTEKEIRKIEQEFKKAETTNIENILKVASKILGFLSKYLSIIIIPEIQNITVEKLEIFPLTGNRLLFVLALNSNLVETLTIEAEFDIEESQIESIVNHINEKISGKSLKFIYENFYYLIEETDYKESPIINLFFNFFDKIYNNLLEQERTMISGVKYLLDYPEFQEPQHIKRMITILENSDLILKVLNKFSNQDSPRLKILIGTETENELLYDFSIIASPYWITNAIGYIGLLGPKRMNYPKVIKLVDVISKVISQNYIQSY